ncbi:MAG: transporter substrate-binding domain-containing protein [Erysipelotrichaceae bacterium]|nr:transporter substrate-binding domain-containing protein [Erysipelotrichaceae bacterium]
MKKTNALLTAVLAVSLVGCTPKKQEEQGDHLARIQVANTLNIALEGTWQPWSYHDESGELVGYDVEVGEAIAKELGVEANFTEGAWDGLLAGLSSGRYDLVINGVDITEEREKNFDFSDPYAYTHTVLVVDSNNNDIQSFEDLSGKETANSINSTYMQIGEEYGASVEGVDTLEDTINMVTSGRVDATINSDVSIADYLKTTGSDNIKVVDQTKDVIHVAIPLTKGEDSATLKEAINKAIQKLKDDGTLAQLSEKYFGIDVTK